MKSLVGETLGHYQIVTRLGSGGIGEVYRATDLRLMRDVALKVLRADCNAEDEGFSWLQQEARMASSLNHPNIVTIHDIGTENSTAYIAMEFVKGTTLRELLSAGLPQLDRLLKIGAQIADGLAKAHEAGIVHRDIKPENLMLTEDGLVKILDFGLAKSLDRWNRATTKRDTPILAGTIAYMSPEQVRGTVIDFRSDQFTLGIILYEMATGRRMFERATPFDTLAAIAGAEHESLRKLNLGMPLQFSLLIDKCLSKNPAGRYDSTRELAGELNSIHDEVARKVSKKHKPIVAVIVTAVLAVLMGEASPCD
jgi:serine/threonine protein kinase